MPPPTFLQNPAARAVGVALSVGLTVGVATLVVAAPDGDPQTGGEPLQAAASRGPGSDRSSGARDALRSNSPPTLGTLSPLTNSMASTSTPSTTTPTTATAPDPASTAPDRVTGQGPVVVSAGDAGTVTVVLDPGLALVSVTPAPGWGVEVEQAGPLGVEVVFRNGSARIDVNVEPEDGGFRARVRDRRTGIETFTILRPGGNAPAPSTTAPPTTAPPTTAPPTTAPTTAPPTTAPTTAPPTTAPTTAPPTTAAPPTAAPPTTAPPTTAPPTTAPSGSVRTITVAGGTVTVRIDGSSLTLLSAQPQPGWSVEIHHDEPDDVSVRFRSGDRESRVELDEENGRIRERIEER